MDIPTLRAGRPSDAGFSFVELLVIIVIVGVLAGIALPQFLSFRARGQETAVVNDLRVAALFMQVYSSDNGTFHEDGLEAFSPSTEGVTITAPFADDEGYCLLGVHDAGPVRSYTHTGLQPPESTCEGFGE